MKKHIKQYSSIFLFLALTIPVISQAAGRYKDLSGHEGVDRHESERRDEDVQKKKTINKTFSVTSEDKLEIDNSFGNVVVSTWDKGEIAVDIEIVVNARTEAKAQDIIDEIEVKQLQSDHIISFKTKVGEINYGNDSRHRGTDNDRAFYIDYVVHMPSANRLQITNSFGKTTLPDFGGEVNLISKFGSLNAGKLNKVDAINVEFGKATIAGVNDGKVSFKYDKESSIGSVTGNVRINTEFSQNVQYNIGDDINDLALYQSYSSIRVIVNKTLSAAFNIHTSFGSFHNGSDFMIKEDREDNNDMGPHFDKDYTGQAGDGKARIKIKSSFGSVRLYLTGASFSKDDDSDKDEDRQDRKVKQKSKQKNKDKDKDSDDDDDDKDSDKDNDTTDTTV